jgi:hypothetical protein
MRTTNMRPELQALFTELYLACWNKEQARKGLSGLVRERPFGTGDDTS